MGNMNFGKLSVFQSGQKNVASSAEARLIVNSTLGKFTINGAVSKALNIAVGENVMFFNNIEDVEERINAQSADIMEWANTNNIDLSTDSGRKAAMKEFTYWFVAKGVPQYTANGEPLMLNLRYTTAEKLAGAIENIDLILNDDACRSSIAEAMGSDLTDADTLVEILKSNNTDEYTKKVKAAVLACVQVPQYHAAAGAKTATTSIFTGVGCQLNFSDTGVWRALKEDLGLNADTVNRNFKVMIDTPVHTDYHNGHKLVSVLAFPLEFENDVEPINRNKK